MRISVRQLRRIIKEAIIRELDNGYENEGVSSRDLDEAEALVASRKNSDSDEDRDDPHGYYADAKHAMGRRAGNSVSANDKRDSREDWRSDDDPYGFYR